MNQELDKFNLFFKLVICCALICLQGCYVSTIEPNFVSEIENVTVAAGEDANLKCAVENLGQHKVAWVQVNTQTILTIHRTVITRNQRVGLSRDSLNSYNLHLKKTVEDDRGWYMCQINTDPMINEMAYLQIVVPPDFEESKKGGEVVVRENMNVSLECQAKGYPPPDVTWMKENEMEKIKPQKIWEGEIYNIEKVSRVDMGAYLCIASNGIQPTISKRVQLRVQFQPMLWIPNQLLGAKLGDKAVLECNTEAYPQSINYWTNSVGEMVSEGKKFVTENREDGYKTYMKLTIHDLTALDYDVYKCIAKNSLGETDGSIRLYEIKSKSTDENKIPMETNLKKIRNEKKLKDENHDYEEITLNERNTENKENADKHGDKNEKKAEKYGDKSEKNMNNPLKMDEKLPKNTNQLYPIDFPGDNSGQWRNFLGKFSAILRSVVAWRLLR